MSNWNIIPFGKHHMKYFNQVDDVKYLKWFIGQLNNDMQIKCCAEAIVKAINKKYKEGNNG